MRAAIGLILLLTWAFLGCASPPDYSGMRYYYDHQPKTILVLPAHNMTTDAEAPHFFMATIGKPLIDHGYYVMPVHLVSEILAREGIGLGGESWEIDPELLHRFLGADAILYVTIESWDTHYAVVASSVNVALRYKLVDAQSGEILFEESGERRVDSQTSQGQHGLGGLLADMIMAAWTAGVTDYVPLASDLNQSVLVGLPPGAYHPDFETTKQQVLGLEQGGDE